MKEQVKKGSLMSNYPPAKNIMCLFKLTVFKPIVFADRVH
ncbi:hypothetical protein FHS11_000760 [Mucilaginibacter gotjawali]|uniref:Uncharacterized protein n=1 Tax=Mucilaginibacter gotjawali TaxID=1550579 RepID=A0A839SBM1_9SPHI|nr:hypothetical protein [Mucilaginibacter gotjawali]